MYGACYRSRTNNLFITGELRCQLRQTGIWRQLSVVYRGTVTVNQPLYDIGCRLVGSANALKKVRLYFTHRDVRPLTPCP